MSTRTTVNGLRHYNCHGVNKPLPSVTSILSATQSAKTQQKLAHWNKLNPGKADKAAERGTWFHEAVENYVRGKRVIPPESYFPYWRDVEPKLEEVLDGANVMWSEKPLNQPTWNKYVGEDGVGRIHWYDDITGYGYAGCCDIIYRDSMGQIILGDFKTSVGPYSARFPKKGATITEEVKKALISGVFKCKKTQLQLAAYKQAAEACLGIKIDKTQIFVTTPVEDFSVQVFTFGEKEVEKHTNDWMALVHAFYSKP